MPNTFYQTPGGPKGDIIQFTGQKNGDFLSFFGIKVYISQKCGLQSRFHHFFSKTYYICNIMKQLVPSRNQYSEKKNFLSTVRLKPTWDLEMYHI